MCFINICISFKQILHCFVAYIITEHIESVSLVNHGLFCQRYDNFVSVLICKKGEEKDSNFNYVTMKSDLCIS